MKWVGRREEINGCCTTASVFPYVDSAIYQVFPHLESLDCTEGEISVLQKHLVVAFVGTD